MVQAINKTQAQWQKHFDQIELFSDVMIRLASDGTAYNATSGSFRNQLISLFTSSVTQFDTRVATENTLKQISDNLTTLLNSMKSTFQTNFIKTEMKEFIASDETAVGGGENYSDSSSNILARYTDILGDFRRQMDEACTCVATSFTNWAIRGRIASTNCGPQKQVWAKAYPTDGNTYVICYKNSAMTSEVSRGVVAASSGTITLSESNSSGLDGVVTVSNFSTSAFCTVYTQTVLQCGVSAAAAVRMGHNSGKVLLNSLTALQTANNGDVVTVECTSNTLGAETFSVNSKLKDGDFNATIHQSYNSLICGLSFTLAREYTFLGASSSGTYLSVSTLTGETETNCPAGIYYGTINVSGANSYISLYKETGRTTLVARGFVNTTVGGACVMTASNNGPTVTLQVTADLPAENFTLDLNQSAVGDQYTVQLSNDEAGVYQWFFCEHFLTILPNVASSPTITEPA